MTELQSGRDSDEDDVQKFFGCVNRLLQQLSGWLVSDDLGGEDAECVGPELVWLHVICDCEAGWMYCQIHIGMSHFMTAKCKIHKFTFGSYKI